MVDADKPTMDAVDAENRFGGLLEFAPDAIVVVNTEGRIVFVNSQTEQLFGYPREEMLDRPVEMLLPELLRDVHRKHRADYVAAPRTRPMGIGLDLVARRKDGSEFPVEISLSPMATGEGLLVTGIVRDITDRKRGEAERSQLLREQAARAAAEKTAHLFQRLQSITDVALTHLSREDLLQVLLGRIREITEADVASVFLMEPDGRSLAEQASLGLEKVAQPPVPIPVGKGFIGRIAGERRLLTIENGKRLLVVDSRLQASGVHSLLGAPMLVEGEVTGVLYVGRLKARKFEPEDTQLLPLVADRAALAIDHARLFHDAQQEIEERKLAEERLRESEARTRAILTTAADGIITIDERGIIQLFNPAAESIFGYAAEEAIGRSVSMLMPSPDRENHDSHIARYLRTGEKRIIGIGREVMGRRKDGTDFPMELAVSEVRLGERRLFTGIARDLTERHRMEQQLLQAQKMESIGRLAGGVAHDFNNLLTAILGYAELAEDALSPGSSEHGYVQNIQKAALRAADLTRQLLAFARRQIIEPRIVYLNDLMFDVDRMLRRLIGEDIELTTLPAPDLWPVKADPSQIGQVIVNLAVNARDAMPLGGKLTIETANVALDEEYARQHVEAKPGEYVMLAVSDTGVGMTEEVKARIFEPFYTTKEHGKGTGLGLATCYGIVKQSGGHIAFYSEPDRGTTFKIYLPRAGEQAALLPREEPVPLPSGSETVLLVEDEALVRDIAAQTLRARGYTVLEAGNGDEALRVVQSHRGMIDLVITDVVMPQMGGTELAERLEEMLPGIKVLFTSGYTDNAIVSQGVLEPNTAFLHKPFTPGAIARKVREVLDTGR
jgi:PAS domain S-box-containing protein